MLSSHRGSVQDFHHLVPRPDLNSSLQPADELRHCLLSLDADDNLTDEWNQLLDFGLFPASNNRPATAFTFHLLDHFQELSFQSKVSLYDFWKTLERTMDNSGAYPPLVSLCRRCTTAAQAHVGYAFECSRLIISSYR